VALPPTPLPDPTPAPTPSQAGAVPPWMVLGVALLVTGGVAQLLYKVSPTAGYLFALMVIMGYVAFGDRASKLTGFLSTLGVGPGR
jgi:hypothetical protein